MFVAFCGQVPSLETSCKKFDLNISRRLIVLAAGSAYEIKQDVNMNLFEIWILSMHCNQRVVGSILCLDLLTRSMVAWFVIDFISLHVRFDNAFLFVVMMLSYMRNWKHMENFSSRYLTDLWDKLIKMKTRSGREMKLINDLIMRLSPLILVHPVHVPYI